jgi:hypothetical protein
MNTKILMSITAGLLVFAGLALTFMPEEIGYLISGEMASDLLLLQIMGSLYFAFAMLNWMARGNLIGGIYSRPVAVANLTHFFIGGMALLKSTGQHNSAVIWVIGLIYLTLAILFGIVVYTHPVKAVKNTLS